MKVSSECNLQILKHPKKKETYFAAGVSVIVDMFVVVTVVVVVNVEVSTSLMRKYLHNLAQYLFGDIYVIYIFHEE